MKRSYFAKTVFILLVIALGVVLILPTMGEKRMQISFTRELSQDDRSLIEKRFPAESFQVSLSGKSALVKGYNLSDAVMNEVKTWDGVDDTVFLSHWSEDPFGLVGKSWLAKKINLGLDLQGGMLLVLQADYEKMAAKRGKELTEDEKREITSQALEKINNRINTFGVSEPSIRTKGTEAIEIQLPGVRNPESVKKPSVPPEALNTDW
jgi:hypothetical protein